MISEQTKFLLLAIAGLVLITGGMKAFQEVMQSIQILIGIESFIAKIILKSLAESFGVNPALVEAVFLLVGMIGLTTLALGFWAKIKGMF
jgi:hypothetical protein